ncbi:MAG: hypothetical protein ACXAD7_21465, partial [Candidatus Kariarchaeaceae archaeon]
DGTFSTILDPNDLFYYYSIYGTNRTLFIQFKDDFVEHNVFDIKVEYTYSTAVLSGYPFVLDLDVSTLVSDIYSVDVIAFDIHNNKVIKTYYGVNIDNSGPTINPLFINDVSLNNTSGSITFDISDPNGVDNVSLYYSAPYTTSEYFDFLMEENVYYGTFDFRDGSNGVDPTGWTISESYGDIQVISAYQGHKKIVDISDDSDSSGSAYNYMENSFTGQTAGTIELWVATNDTRHRSYALIPYSSSTVAFQIYIDNNNFYYWNGSQNLLCSVLNSTWYHIKVVFNSSSDTVDVIINDDLKFNNAPYENTCGDIDKIRIQSYGTDKDYAAYYDAISYSWDSTSHSNIGYKVGWNLNPYDIAPLLGREFVPTISWSSTIAIDPLIANQTTVLELYDDNSEVINISYLVANYTKGNSEFLWGTTNNSKYSYITFLEGQVNIIKLAIIDGTFQYFEGSWQDTGKVAVNGQIFNHKIVFVCANESFDWYIDNNLIVSNGNFKTGATHLNVMTIETDAAHSDYSVYFDTVKFNSYVEYEFSGSIDTTGTSWTFNFNEPLLTGTHGLTIVANDSLGYISTFSGYDIFFDNTLLGFFPETLPNGYLFNGSNLIYITNSTSALFNKTIKSLHIYATSQYVDLGYYTNFPPNFNTLVIDSARIPDGEHTLYFEFVDVAGNTFVFNYSIIVDNSPPIIENLSINNQDFQDIIYFNDQADLSIGLNDVSDISSVKLYTLKVLGDPAIYEIVGNEKNWSSFVIRRMASDPGESYYLDPNNLTYSFYDGWNNSGVFVYQNILYWNDWDTGIPFVNLSIYDIEKAYSADGTEIPFFFDNIKQEISFDERYREYLTDDITLKGIKCNLGWNTSFNLNGNEWQLDNFDIEDYLLEDPEEWWDNVFGFDNDDSQYHIHYDHPQQFTRDKFEFYIEIEDIYGNVLITQIYKGVFDKLRAEGSFGRIIGDSSNGVNYWPLGKTGEAGNIIFGTSNGEYNTVYFTPGYIYNSSSDSYYLKYGFSFLHNIESIRLYNATNYYLGTMIFDSTITPHPVYTFELNPTHFGEGLTYIKAEIIDKAQNNYTILQDLYIFKEGDNALQNALSFGDIVYYERDQNYTENPIQFSGYLDNWQDIINHANKSDIQVDMNYWDYSEQIWLPMGYQTTTDGTFTVDWHVDNNTFYKLLPHQRSYLPINYTFDQQPNNNYFYGSYGYFDDRITLHPFLIDMNGNVYVYSYNASNNQWFINFTVPLGFSMTGKVISHFDLNQDTYTDLVIYNKLANSDNISLYLFDSYSLSYTLNQTILASSISLPQSLSNPIFTEYSFDLESDQYLSMYVCVSNSSNILNYIARLDFDSDLARTQENDGTQLPANRVISAINIIDDNVFVGAINPSYNYIVNSSIFSIDKDLINFTMFEDMVKGAILELDSFSCPLGEVVVAGLSMNNYNEDDSVLYYIYDTSTETWYKTSFSLDSELESFSNEVYDFKIHSIVASKEEYFESVLISSSQGLWRTYIDTNVLTISPTPILYAVDTFRPWDLYQYEIDSQTSVLPLTHYPVIDIINIFEFNKYLDLGYYGYDELRVIEPSSYYISADKKSIVCLNGSDLTWRAKTQDDSDLYYEVRYFYEATVAYASGLLSASYKIDEYEHVGNVAAQNTQMKADKLGFQLLNPHDLNHWTFYYGTDYQDWNFQKID